MADILLNWPAIVGADLAAYTAPRRIRWPKAPDRGVDDPAQKPAQKTASQGRIPTQKTTLEVWVAGGRAHEIPYRKAAILARINAYFGYRAVTDLMPVDGPIVRPMPQPRPAPLRAHDITAVAAAHNLDANTPLGEALAKLGANIARRSQARRAKP